jgi:Flp pilus assembly protein TadD/mono/diheme cytochrome c family protein
MFPGRRRIKGLRNLCAFLLASAPPITAQTPTFNRDIAPILYQNCSTCHRPGGTGPFSLLSYDDAKRHVREIGQVTQRRFMPPWLPEEGYGDFADARRLSDAQIRAIQDWVKAGAPEGNGAAPAPPTLESEWPLGKPDLIVKAETPFTVPASGSDVFWNFTFQPDLEGTRYVRAIDIRPGGLGNSARNIHHANAIVDRNGSSRKLEAKPGSGFAGMEITVDRNPFDPPGHFLFWKPGSEPYSEKKGFSWRLDPGNRLILNTHLQPDGKAESLQPAIALYFTSDPPTRGPLLMELENDDKLDIPAGRTNFRITDSFRLPMDVDVLAIYPHAHYLGKTLEAFATLPDGSKRPLIRIPDWDLNWQAVYRYREPVYLPAGSVISMNFLYDNSADNPRNPNRPPARVIAGNRAKDEMGHLWLQVLPRGRGDRRREFEEALLRHRLEKVPQDPDAHLNLGAVLLSRLKTQDAIEELQTSIRLNARAAQAHDMLGSAYRSVGRSMDAVNEYRRALQIDSSYANARYNLATSLARAKNFAAAVPEFRSVITSFPKDSRLRNEFGEVLAASGDLQGALDQFNEAVKLDSTNAYAAKNRDWVIAKMQADTKR